MSVTGLARRPRQESLSIGRFFLRQYNERKGPSSREIIVMLGPLRRQVARAKRRAGRRPGERKSEGLNSASYEIAVPGYMKKTRAEIE
ncbi:hypothetical protein EVAR_59241_1 [Eumeta japonica]|uniref:Uncharacterized protein n=1 Tax=Eumeta variegata TaxID=151549 RepID=A0A4C2A0Q0_EUMVA|nr:hypothetical protein EVAR_59241_1 [Eumeta japonica]